MHERLRSSPRGPAKLTINNYARRWHMHAESRIRDNDIPQPDGGGGGMPAFRLVSGTDRVC